MSDPFTMSVAVPTGVRVPLAWERGSNYRLMTTTAIRQVPRLMPLPFEKQAYTVEPRNCRFVISSCDDGSAMVMWADGVVDVLKPTRFGFVWPERRRIGG